MPVPDVIDCEINETFIDENAPISLAFEPGVESTSSALPTSTDATKQFEISSASRKLTFNPIKRVTSLAKMTNGRKHHCRYHLDPTQHKMKMI